MNKLSSPCHTVTYKLQILLNSIRKWLLVAQSAKNRKWIYNLIRADMSNSVWISLVVALSFTSLEYHDFVILIIFIEESISIVGTFKDDFWLPIAHSLFIYFISKPGTWNYKWKCLTTECYSIHINIIQICIPNLTQFISAIIYILYYLRYTLYRPERYHTICSQNMSKVL